MSENLIEERKEKILNFLMNKKTLLVLLGLAILLILAWHTRTVNVENLKDVTTGEYTLGPDLDPFLFLRYAKTIVQQGGLPEVDMMRYVPLGFKTAKAMRLHPYMIAYFHQFLNFFSDVSINYSALIYPVFMFLLTVLAFFLFVNKTFENKKNGRIIALVSTAFLIVSPSLLARTVAGIPEKESAGFFFIFATFYFLISAWKSEKVRKSLILASLAGISTGMMGLIWGGWIYIFMSVAAFFSASFFLNLVDDRRFYIFSLWLLFALFLPLPFTIRYSLKSLVSSSSTGLASAVYLLLLTDFVIFKTKIKKIRLIRNLRKKYPNRVISLLVFLALGLIVSSVVFGFSFIFEFLGGIISQLKQPYSSRLLFTVAENRQPYFSTWKNSFGPVIRGIPLIFWMFFIGSIFLVYETVKKLKEKWKITSVYVLFLLGLIFSRYSQNSTLNGENLISRFLYFGSILFLVSFSAYLYYKYHQESRIKELKKVKGGYLLVLAYFFVSIVGARSAIRLIMGLAPPAAIIVGYFGVKSFEIAKKQKDETLKFLALALAVIVIISSLYSFYFNYNVTIASAKSMVPSSYTQQWQRAMEWVREETPQDAVFSHWWDYGYWLQSIGERATVLDGGNSISYWNHLMGRHVLTGKTEREALEFLYAHNVTHFLIDSTEIGKYSAYSSIGGDENYDRYSQMPTFQLDESQTRETKNETVYSYRGYMFLDQDFIWKENGNQEFFPAYNTGIGGVILKVGEGGMKQPEAVFFYQGKQKRIPMSCVYFEDEEYEFEKGYGGCLYLLPKLKNDGGGVSIDNKGAGLFITEKSMEALWVKLYLFGEGENFKLVHKEESEIVENLKMQNLTDMDLVNYQGTHGPIKIWEVSYPSDIEFKEEYLSTHYPQEVKEAKDIF